MATGECPNCERLKARIAELERTIARLERRVDELERAGKRQAAPFSKGEPKEDPKPRGRKPGEDYGVKACRQPPEKVDEVIPVSLPPRCDCGGDVVYDETVQQFQTEIPKRPIHRRFDICVGHCRRCGKRVQGRHPLQTSDAIGAAAPQMGADAQAMTSILKDKVGVSYGDIETIFHDFFGVSLSRGGAAQIVLRTAERAQAAYGGIQIVVRRSRTCCPDETGWKVAGFLHWLWVHVVRTATLFTIARSRGFDVPEAILGAEWSGTMTHDGWSPYDRFENALHQQCLGHIDRRCKNLLEVATRGAVRFPRAVRGVLGDALDLRDRRDADEISPHGLAVATGRLKARLEDLLRWRLTHRLNRKLQRHLARHDDQIFTFLRRPGVEATSWLADHAIRPAVANRKVFGGNRDPAGARAQAILSSIFATCVQRGVAAFRYLSCVLRAPPRRRDERACRLLSLPQPT